MPTTIKKLALLALMLTCLPSQSIAADALLRIFCEGADTGAEVYINGKFSGECPVNQSVPEGNSSIRVVKNVDSTHERVFEQTVRLAGGNVKRIDVQLSAPRLTAAVQKVEDARLAVERNAREARERAVAVEFDKLLAAAMNGDAKAMLDIGTRYQNGNGVAMDSAQGLAWLSRSAASGNEVAGFMLSKRYQKPVLDGDKPAIKAVLHFLGLPRDNPRLVNVVGFDKVKEFVESDPFFAMASISDPKPASFNYNKSVGLNGSDITNVKGICRREGVFTNVERVHTRGKNSTDYEDLTVLGGLVPLRNEIGASIFGSMKTVDIATIRVVYGQPFPLVANKRFGVIYGMHHGGGSLIAVDCMAGFDKEPATELVCVTHTLMNDVYPAVPVVNVQRWSFDEASGCLLGGYLE